MDRLAAGIALGVILFVTVVIGVLIVRGHRASGPREVSMSSEADQALKEVHLREDAKSGKYRWSLDAERAESLPDAGKTSLWKVTIGVQESDQAWTVTSDEGDLYKDTKDVELRGHVVLTNSDGLRVETTVLRWNNAEGRAWTDQPVTLYRGGGVVTGLGLETRPSEEVTSIRGRVRATFSLSKSRRTPAPTSPGMEASQREAAEPLGRGKP
jgi:LPS export ABC transporter protein LptC